MSSSSKSKFSFFRFLIVILVIVANLAMGAFVYFSWQPMDLSGIDGRVDKDESKEVDVLEKMQAAKNGLYEVTITEEELNLYIASNLELVQSGVIDEYVDVKGVYVDLTPDHIEVIIEREINYVDPNAAEEEGGAEGEEKEKSASKVPFLPMDNTVSMKLKIYTVEDEEGQTKRVVEFPGGSFGQAPAPGQFIHAVKDSFDAIAEHFSKEIDLAWNEMTRLEIGDGFIRLDPRREVREVGPGSGGR